MSKPLVQYVPIPRRLPQPAVVELQPLLVSEYDAVKLLATSLAEIRNLIAQGELQRVVLDDQSLVVVASIEALVARRISINGS
jgi:hypothetical protein